MTITPTKNPGGRIARTNLVAGIRQRLGAAAEAGAKLLKDVVEGKQKLTVQRYDAIKWTIEHVIGRATVAVDLTGTIDGVIRHDHILKTADALLNQSPGPDGAPLTEAQMAQEALGADAAGTYADEGATPLLSPVGEEAAMDKED